MISSLRTQAQCTPPELKFTNPVLFSGDGTSVGSVYLFKDVWTGVDAQVELLNLSGGAQLGEIDNTTNGYFDAWQPFVTAGANDTSILEWRISFYKAGLNVPYTFPCLAVTAVDVDGDNMYLKEFVEAATPGAFAVDPFTVLSVSFDGVRTKAIGQITTIPLIDTARREAMFQMNFTNVSTLDYRNGAISTKATPDTRHTSIYFKQFFNQLTFLPVKLMDFRGSSSNNLNQIYWTATDEKDVLYYVVESSTNGREWTSREEIRRKNSGSGIQAYEFLDGQSSGQMYYRLKVMQTSGFTYSSILFLRSDNEKDGSLLRCGSFLSSGSLPLQLNVRTSGNYRIFLMNYQGQIVAQSTRSLNTGTHFIQFPVSSHIASGSYILQVRKDIGEIAASKKLIR